MANLFSGGLDRELTRDESLARIKGLSHHEARTLIKQRDLRLDKDVLKILYALEYLENEGDISIMDAFYLGIMEGVRLLDPGFSFIPEEESDFKYTKKSKSKSKHHATSATNETSPTSSILTSEPSSPVLNEVASQTQREKVLREFVHMIKPTRFEALDEDIVTEHPYQDYFPGRIIAKFGKMEMELDFLERLKRNKSVWHKRTKRKEALDKKGKFLVDFATFTNDIDCNKPSQDEAVFYNTSATEESEEEESDEDLDDADLIESEVESEVEVEEDEEELEVVDEESDNEEDEETFSSSAVQDPTAFLQLLLPSVDSSASEEEQEEEEEFSSPVSIPEVIIKKSSPAFEHLPLVPRKLFSDILAKNSLLKSRTSSTSINQILNDSSDTESGRNRNVRALEGSSKGNTVLEKERAENELKRKRDWEEEVEPIKSGWQDEYDLKMARIRNIYIETLESQKKTSEQLNNMYEELRNRNLKRKIV